MVTKSYATYHDGIMVIFGFNLERPEPGKLTLPCFFETSYDNPNLYFHSKILESEFDQDIESLTPKKISVDWLQECRSQLKNTIANHISRFNRITPADLETYITESVLIISAIGVEMGKPISLEMLHMLFRNLLVNFSKDYGIPVEIKFSGSGKF